jgi:ABC-type sugar transport system ATPase subunit
VNEAVRGAPDARDGETPAMLIEAVAVAKSFGATRALRNASFELRAGEVHALVGENGSGKSTLVKILSGVHIPDAGVIRLGETDVRALRTPRVAQEHGIATVFQEVLVSEARSVLDNVWLGADGLVRTRISPREKRERAAELLEELLGRSLDLNTIVEELALSDRQACGIVRALLRRPRILILDEATSSLDIATRDRLFGIVSRLCSQGAGIVFITHRMDELSEIGDRITIMRSGTTVGTLGRGEWTPAELVRLMTGTDQLTADARSHVEGASTRLGPVVLRARGLRLAGGRKPFDVDIRAGELLGVAGLEGHGQDEFLEVLRGIPAAQGELIRQEHGKEVVLRSPRQAARHDIAYVARERRHSVFAWMSIRENFGMPTLRRDTRGGFLRVGATRKRFAEHVKQLGIVFGKQGDRITTLSGGNQQKVVIARWLAARPKVLLLNDPTRGIDVGTKRDLYVLLAKLADDGLAMVMLSSELDEHVELMDRVLVFREHELFCEIDRAQLSRSALVSAFFGEEGTASGNV